MAAAINQCRTDSGLEDARAYLGFSHQRFRFVIPVVS